MTYTHEQVRSLAEAMWRLLHDMSTYEHAMCGGPKAMARVSLKPFFKQIKDDEYFEERLMSFDEIKYLFGTFYNYAGMYDD